MEAKKIEVVKDWPEPKSVQDIQVFSRFANFYQQFVQGFSRIAAPLTSMLKTTRSPNELAPSKNDGSRLVSNRNDDSKPASGKNNGNREVVEFGVGGSGGDASRKNNGNDKVVEFGIGGGVNKSLNRKID